MTETTTTKAANATWAVSGCGRTYMGDLTHDRATRHADTCDGCARLLRDAIRREAFEEVAKALRPAWNIIDLADQQALAADGPVPTTAELISRDDMTKLLKAVWRVRALTGGKEIL